MKKCFGRPIDYILEYMEFMFNQQKSEDDQTVRTEHEEVLKTESFRDLGVYSTKLDRYWCHTTYNIQTGG